MTADQKPKTLEFRDMCDLLTAVCEFCAEDSNTHLHAYLCRESGTGNYRDYIVFAHPSCFVGFLKAQFDETTQNRGL